MLVIWQVVIVNVLVSVWAWLSWWCRGLGVYACCSPGSLCLLKGPWGMEPRAECSRAVPSLHLCPSAAPCFWRVVSSQCRVCLDLRAPCPCASPCPGPGAVTTVPLIKGRLTQIAALCFFPCSVGQRRSAPGWWVHMLLEQVWGCLVSVCVCTGAGAAPMAPLPG